MSWETPGYVALELLGFGASGEVWRGRDTATGDVVALKRLRVGRDPAEQEALRREAALLSAFHHPHVVALRAVLGTRDGLVLVLDYASGGSLGGLLARQGALPATRVAALIGPLAQALAAAHAVGLVHGDISSGNILLDGSGRPLLADLGTARLMGDAAGPVYATVGFVDPAVGVGQPPGPRSDVYALGALAVIALSGPAAAADPAAAARALTGPDPLVRLLRRMVCADPGARPAAAEVAEEIGLDAAQALVGDAAEPAPVSSVALTHAVAVGDGPAGRHRSAPVASPPRRRGRRLTLGLLAAVLAVLGVAAAAGGGYLWGGSQPAPAPARVAAAAPSWAQVWTALDARRSAAFARADPTALDRVYLPGCPALPADLRAVRDLSARRAYAVGVGHETRSVQLESATQGAASLIVVDRMDGYQVRDAAGRVLASTGPRGDRRLRAGLVNTDRGWLIATLAAA